MFSITLWHSWSTLRNISSVFSEATGIRVERDELQRSSRAILCTSVCSPTRPTYQALPPNLACTQLQSRCYQTQIGPRFSPLLWKSLASLFLCLLSRNLLVNELWEDNSFNFLWWNVSFDALWHEIRMSQNIFQSL